MGMNMKTGKEMKGFMCNSLASTAVCMPQDQWSAIVPRRPNRSLVVRLGEQQHPTIRRSFPAVSTLNKKDQDYVFHQEVVMKVSIHCQGCADKLKKHLSRMEGVTSFNIDLDSKRVTVMGHVSPSGVLESISKVKKAEFWPC